MDEVSNDYDLLRQYVEAGSDAAFATLVSRHTDMIYSAARRQVGPGGLADEVTQAVFILLVRKADKLPAGTIVAAWLFKATRYTSMNALRAQARRRRHERKAAQMAPTQTVPTPAGSTWPLLAPLLDEAIARLGPADRAAVILRFLERRSLAEVGRSLGVSEHAAQMRVSRAVDKLRGFFLRRGITLTAAALGVVLTAHATQAAPPALTSTLSLAALQHAGSASTGPAVLADAAGRTMVAGKVRVVVALFAAAAGVACLIAVAVHLVNDLPLPLHKPAEMQDKPVVPKSFGLAGRVSDGLFR